MPPRLGPCVLERLGALDTLVARLAEVDPAARETLLVAGQAGVVEILIEALENADARVRFVVVEILGEVRNPAVALALVARLDQEPDPRIRAAVVRSLANLQETSAVVAISTGSSRRQSAGWTRAGFTSAARPRIRPMFTMFEPMTLPKATSPWPPAAASTPTMISGADVP